jgi:hypothetical protein
LFQVSSFIASALCAKPCTQRSINMKLKLLGLSALLVLCLAATAPAADQQGENISDQEVPMTEAATAVANNALAAQLADHARQTQSPMALAVAAQMLATYAVEDAPMAKTDESGAAVPSVPGEQEPDAQALFAEAVAMAKEQQNVVLADLIDKQAQASGQTRGRVRGTVRHVDVVRGNSRDVYRVTFRGGTPAVVTARSTRRENIDLYIYDQNNRLIRRATSYGGAPISRWTPKWTGQYSVQVVNRTGRNVNYTLVTNR